MDIRKIKKLIEMLQDSDLTEIEVGQGDESVRITRQSIKTQQVYVASNSLEESKNNFVENKNASKNEDIKIQEDGNTIKSPIVGTFYRKPSPDKDPFVRVGDIVKKGDILCIIEAMKMMNEIKSEYEGKITSIKVQDGEPVEYGQPIITIS